MTFDEYQGKALRTKNRGDIGGISDLAVAGLGIAGEAGEVADEVKKVLGHGKAMDTDKLVKEVGDVLWYAASIAEDIGVPLSEIARRNIAKLETRYPNGFTTAASLAKADATPPSNDGDKTPVGLPDGVPFSFAPVQVWPPVGSTDSVAVHQLDSVPATDANGKVVDLMTNGHSVTLRDYQAGYIADIKRRILAGEPVTLSVEATPDGLSWVADLIRRANDAGCDHESGCVQTDAD